MSRFLFATMPATGHVAPKLPIARELVSRGHDVHWYTGATYRSLVTETGAVHHAISSAEDFGGQSLREAFPELARLTGLDMVRAAFQRVFIDNAEGMLRDCQQILARHPFDVIMSEPLFVAARWLHELGGPPWATLGETMLGTYSVDTAPVGPGLPPLPGPAGWVRNRLMNAVHRRVLFGGVTHHYERARNRVGLPALGQSFIDTFIGPYLYMQSTVPSFEYPRSDLPGTVHFIGPLLPQPRADADPPSWWPELEDDRSVVLVTQGTVATDPHQLMVPSIRALAGEEALVVVTTGGPVDELLAALGGHLPDNVRAVQFIPYAELMPQVDVLITNGGYGTVQHALSYGIPIIVAGATEDKPEVAARIAWSGTGLRLRAQSPSVEDLAAAMRSVQSDPRYRARAVTIAQEMRSYDAPRTAADLLEELAETQAAVSRADHSSPRVRRASAAGAR
jgi:UDP:flavonoid glycosyltransferase YjiC (YdhE family)